MSFIKVIYFFLCFQVITSDKSCNFFCVAGREVPAHLRLPAGGGGVGRETVPLPQVIILSNMFLIVSSQIFVVFTFSTADNIFAYYMRTVQSNFRNLMILNMYLCVVLRRFYLF